MRDITEQRKAREQIVESEKKLRAIFDASKDGIILLDRNLCLPLIISNILFSFTIIFVYFATEG